MNPKSSIEKGKRFEKYICEEIQNFGLGKARRESGSGSGKYKGDIFANLPFLLEAKNQETIHLLDWIKQSQRQAEQGNWDKNKWALIIRNPDKPEFEESFAVIDLFEFFELLKKNNESLIKQPDKELKYDLESLKIMCNRIINKL